MYNFKFKSVQRGDTVYVERHDWKQLVDCFLQLQEVAKAAAKLKPYDFYDAESDCCIGCAGIALEHNSIDRTVIFDHQEGCEVEELFTALTALQEPDGHS